MQPETTQRKLIWWGINIVVLLYAFIPVITVVVFGRLMSRRAVDGAKP